MPPADPLTGRPLGEWWRRLLAYLLDGLVIGIPTWLVVQLAFTTAIFSINLPTNCRGPNPAPNCGNEIFHRLAGPLIGAFAVVGIVAFAVGALYFTLMIGSRRGQTVGMMALSIAVRDERRDESIGYGRAFVRWIVIVALGLLVVPQLVDFLSPLWDRRQQAWHDHAAGSLVVDVRFSRHG